MSFRRLRLTIGLLLAGLAGLTVIPASGAGEGVVWLTARVDGGSTEARIRIPLEWIANVDNKEHSEIKFDDHTIDCTELWLAHKDLPIGESVEIDRGVTEDGEKYVASVVSEQPSRNHAQGKVHIQSKDQEGKSTDVRFPLDIAGLFQKLGAFVESFFGFESSDDHRDAMRRVDVGDAGDMKKLADYGPFVFLDSREPDGSRVKISIE